MVFGNLFWSFKIVKFVLVGFEELIGYRFFVLWYLLNIIYKEWIKEYIILVVSVKS